MSNLSADQEKRQPPPPMVSGDLKAVLRDGLIVVRDITLVDEVHMTRDEAVALAKWILEHFA